MNYNKYNSNYLFKIEQIYQTFNKTELNSYNQLLQLIYEIYGSQNIFIIIDENIKFQFKSIITLIINNNRLIDFKFESNNKIIKDLIDFLIFINDLLDFENNFILDQEIISKLETYLLKINLIDNELVKQQKNIFLECSSPASNFDNDAIIYFFNKYSIDFNNPIITINDTKIPNFYLMKKNKNIDHYYEFLHLLFKIYAPLLYYGTTFEEGYEYKITSKDIVFDCGGNMGLFSLYCASKGATVYSFEPMSYVRDFLKISQSLYPTKINIIEAGVGDKNRVINFTQTFNPGASSNIKYHLHHSPTIYKEQGKIISIDDFCKKNNIFPTFIKADIEGGEKDMLIGAKNILQNNKPIIHLCLNHKDNDIFELPMIVKQINDDYNFYPMYEGDARSQYVLCI